MRGRAQRIMGLAVIALNGAAVAQVADAPSESDNLSLHLQSKISCDADDLVQVLTSEIILVNAARDEIVEALREVRLDEATCAPLKDASLELQTLAENEPTVFDQAFGFGQDPLPVEQAALDVPVQFVENVYSEPEKPLRPPRFSLLKTRSSY